MIAVARGDEDRVGGEARVIIMVCIPERMCGAAAGAASTLA